MNLVRVAAIFHKAAHPGTQPAEAKAFARKLREIKSKDVAFAWWRINNELCAQNSYSMEQCAHFVRRIYELWDELDNEAKSDVPLKNAATSQRTDRYDPTRCPGPEYRWICSYSYTTQFGKTKAVRGHWRKARAAAMAL